MTEIRGMADDSGRSGLGQALQIIPNHFDRAEMPF
jgi:hypothetical protein